MARHDVKFTVPKRSLGKTDVVFTIDRDGEYFGELKISNGAVVWVPRYAKTEYVISWSRFDEAMRDYARKRR